MGIEDEIQNIRRNVLRITIPPFDLGIPQITHLNTIALFRGDFNRLGKVIFISLDWNVFIFGGIGSIIHTHGAIARFLVHEILLMKWLSSYIPCSLKTSYRGGKKSISEYGDINNRIFYTINGGVLVGFALLPGKQRAG